VLFSTCRTISFDQASQGSLDQIVQALTLLATQQKESNMAIIAEVQNLITANQTLVALVNQLITKIGTPSTDVTDTAAAATSELSAVNAAITAAQAILNPPQT
jgi:hypothetical protein